MRCILIFGHKKLKVITHENMEDGPMWWPFFSSITIAQEHFPGARKITRLSHFCSMPMNSFHEPIRDIMIVNNKDDHIPETSRGRKTKAKRCNHSNLDDKRRVPLTILQPLNNTLLDAHTSTQTRQQRVCLKCYFDQKITKHLWYMFDWLIHWCILWT